MATCRTMQEVVTKLAREHGLDLSARRVHLSLEMSGFGRLVVEKSDEYVVHVAHYPERHGGWEVDPEITFFTRYGGWVPVWIRQAEGDSQECAKLSLDGRAIIGVYPQHQEEVADLAETWARAIEAEGWLEHGRAKEPVP